MPTLEYIEKQAILSEYRIQGQNKTRTAKVLGIAVNTLIAKLEKYEAERIAADPGTPGRLPLYNPDPKPVAAPQPVPAVDPELHNRPAAGDTSKKRGR